MSCELDVTDCFGNRVRLAHTNWEKHIDRHPDVVPYHDQIPLALQDPTLVVRAHADGAFHFYRLGVGEGRLQGLYLRVIVGYNAAGDGYVKTCYFTRIPDSDGTIIHIGRTGQGT